MLQSPPGSHQRTGAILLVVLALLTLFAVVDLAFVLYADAAATAARYQREAQTAGRPDLEPELLLAYFLGQLLYDARDDADGVYSALRGHSLARSLYGYDDAALNDVPFNGTGRLHYPSAFDALGLPGTPAEARDDYYLINYTYFRDDPQLSAEQRFLRDPERFGARSGLGNVRRPFTGGFNAPYTYPDLNNLYLAAVKADGTVLLPSFHRPWLFGSNEPRNPNWTNAAGKYLLLRPRPFDMGPGFPYPEDAGGDVKNLVGAPGGNDSYWIDLNAPILLAADGRKYKPLFAPLIVDLDNRVNVNVHGNIRGRGLTHRSNQGWGPWEVNLGQVLNPGEEWRHLLTGTTAPAQPGRYGPNRRPDAGTTGSPTLAGRRPPFHSQVDFDSANEGPGGLPTGRVLLPGAGASPFQCFPRYPAGYGNGSVEEHQDHPRLYNVLTPQGDDRAFAPSNLEALLRYGDTGSTALTSDLFRLCPLNFADARTRRLVTTTSFDLDKPGVTPWIWNPTEQPYTLSPNSLYPQGDAIPFPNLPPRNTPPPGSEFGPDWRANSAGLGRIDLNRPLPDYPAPDRTTGRITDLAGFQRAQQARQQQAQDIYLRLVKVTGVYDAFRCQPTANPPVALPDAGQRDALRWLAQLAVNMVDYVDADDYLTPFAWGAVGSPAFTAAYGHERVYGTELPRVVINEAYVEYANDPTDPGLTATPPRAVKPFQVNFWVELHNPFFSDPSLSDSGAARLQMPEGAGQAAYAVHRLVMARSPNPNLRQPDRVLGDADAGNTVLIVSQYAPESPPTPQPLRDVDVNLIQPANGQFAGTPGANEGFYVLGPKYDFPGTDPARPSATLRIQDQTTDGMRDSMTYEVPNTTPLDGSPREHALLLQRLACPLLPPNPATPGGAVNPNLPHNPYVTIDYLDRVPSNDAVQADAQGPRTPAPPAGQHSHGRNQPYAAHVSQQRRQQPLPALVDQPQHTFFRHNSVAATPPPVAGPGQTLKVPFDWLVHLDRPLISPMELLHVSAFKPHELTQQFHTFAGPFQHYAPWLDPTRRLYRVLEFLQTHSLVEGVSATPGGRVPGKINVNTIWDPETFLALCDPQPANNFRAEDLYRPMGAAAGFDHPSDPQSIYWRMLLTRTPGLLMGVGPGPDDRPFQGLASGPTPPGDPQYPLGSGLEHTLLRSFEGTGSRRLFQPPLPSAASSESHPYLQYQLLTKLFDRLTTRSNVFAVWVTVGLFEVTDDTTRPVKLGAEVGRAEGRQIRHRLFAIVDRSRLPRNFGPPGSAGPVPHPYEPRRDPFQVVLHRGVID